MIHHDRLPQLSGDVFLGDGGLETTLIFHEGLEVPSFASFVLLEQEAGRAAMRRYFRSYTDVAREHGLGLVLETPTWRASRDWGRVLGYDDAALAAANRQSVEMLQEVRAEAEVRVVISGNLGPRGDGYVVETAMSCAEAQRYHEQQVGVLREAGADLITAFTLNYVEEAIGIADASAAVGMPVVLSFTVETDGKLPAGHSLREAIEAVDAATSSYPAYYMINCAHPTHFADALEDDARWTERIGGVRANASALSHAELDEMEELDDGDPAELGAQMAELRRRFPRLGVLGGCCGTDHRHVGAMARAALAGA